MTTTTQPKADDFDLTPAEPPPNANDYPLTDFGGYLACGCHGSQREHTCGPLDWWPEES